jgi:hypothetical protein
MRKQVLAALLIGITFSGIALAQTANVTGKVIAVTSQSVTVQKGKDVWEIKRTNSTKVDGTLRVGSTVTVNYKATDGQKREGPAVSDRDPENAALGAQKKE